MTPIQRNITIYRGTTFTFFIVLRDNPVFVGTFTADPATNVLTSSVAHNFLLGDPVYMMTNGGVLPFPIEGGVTYFIISIPSSTTFKISKTYNGPEVDIINAGTTPNQIFVSRPMDLTGWSVWAWVKETPTGSLILDLAPTIGSPATEGKIDMSKTDEQTIVMTEGNFYWDMVVEDDGGVRIGPLFQGAFTVVHLITEPPE